MKIEEWFEIGMKREIKAPIQPNMTLALDLGPGRNCVPGAQGLDFPHWDALKHEIPYADGSVTAIFASHFLEHIPGLRVITLLREFERVLVPGGTANVCVPYYRSSLQAQDLTHQSAYCEDTWKTLMANRYYDPAGEWKLREHTCFILGIAERNLALFTQFVKSSTEEKKS